MICFVRYLEIYIHSISPEGGKKYNVTDSFSLKPGPYYENDDDKTNKSLCEEIIKNKFEHNYV